MSYEIVYPRSSVQRDVHVTGPYPVPVGDWLVKGIRQSVIGVGLTPIALPTVSIIDRRFISVYNNSDYTIYLGSASVTIGDGQPLESGQPFAINLDQNVILYATGEAALTMCDTRILEGA